VVTRRNCYNKLRHQPGHLLVTEDENGALRKVIILGSDIENHVTFVQ
jgi:hypothetical protein